MTQDRRHTTNCPCQPPLSWLEKVRLLPAACLLACSMSSAAEETRFAYAPPPPPAVSSGSIVQIIFSLFLVLAAIVLVAWLLRRMNLAQQGAGHLLKVLGGVSVGQRERVVLVEIKDTWLVVGVGPGQVRTLHTLPKPEDTWQKDEGASSSGLQPTDNRFAALLSSVLAHRRQKAADK